MEWAVLLAVVLLTAVYVALPRRHAGDAPETPIDELRRLHRELRDELRELDADAAGGRISAQDRQAGRSAVGPRLRAVTEALRERGETPGPAG